MHRASLRLRTLIDTSPLFGKNQLVDLVKLHLPRFVGDSKPGEIHAAGN